MAAQVENIKWIAGTSFMVDGFRFQNPRCQHYFLTHAHSDHTTGLAKSFASGFIYCSPITKALLCKNMGMPTQRIIPLEMDVRHNIDGVGVTLIDANHCPGAAMMLFEVPPPRDAALGKHKVTRILHVGDFRFNEAMVRHPALAGQSLDILYLDTTYCHPRHTHPPQDDCIRRMVEVVRQERAQQPCTLFVIGAYSIGKERAFLGTAKALGWKIWCEPRKVETLKTLRLPEEDLELLTKDKAAARIHVTFMGSALQPEQLIKRMRTARCDHVVGFRPTGWTYKKNGKLEVRKEGPVTVYGVPYSEHSAFGELRECVRLLRPRRLVPTVNVTEDPATTRAIVDRFADLMDLSGDKSRLDSYFRFGSKAGSGTAQCSSGGGGGKPASTSSVAGQAADNAQTASAPLLAVKAEDVKAEPASNGEPAHGSASAAQAAAHVTAAAAEPDGALPGTWGCDSPTASSNLGSGPGPLEAADTAMRDISSVCCNQSAMSLDRPPDPSWASSSGLRTGQQRPLPCDSAGAATEARVHPLEAQQRRLHCASSARGREAAEAPVARSVSAPAAVAAAELAPAGSCGGASGRTDDGSGATPAQAAPAGGFALEGVDLKQQEAILAMIQSRNAHRGNGSGAGGGTLLLAQPALASKASPVTQPSSVGKCKRQRTLQGFLLSPAQTM